MATIRIPSKLKARLNKEHATIIDNNLINFSHILKEERLFFFPEYTDHGINHIEGVLKSIEKLISDENDCRAEYMKNDENLPEVDYSFDENKLKIEIENQTKFRKQENGNHISDSLLYE